MVNMLEIMLDKEIEVSNFILIGVCLLILFVEIMLLLFGFFRFIDVVCRFCNINSELKYFFDN